MNKKQRSIITENRINGKNAIFRVIESTTARQHISKLQSVLTRKIIHMEI
jgi:hypothetical protein